MLYIFKFFVELFFIGKVFYGFAHSIWGVYFFKFRFFHLETECLYSWIISEKTGFRFNIAIYDIGI